MNINVMFVGHLGADPDLRETPQGQQVCNFSVASNRSWTGPDDERKEEVTWFRLAAWGPLAQVCDQYLRKGSPVFVLGRLQPDRETGGPRVWLDSNGAYRASFEVTAVEVKFLGGRTESSGMDESDAEIVSEEDAQEIPF